MIKEKLKTLLGHLRIKKNGDIFFNRILMEDQDILHIRVKSLKKIIKDAKQGKL